MSVDDHIKKSSFKPTNKNDILLTYPLINIIPLSPIRIIESVFLLFFHFQFCCHIIQKNIENCFVLDCKLRTASTTRNLYVFSGRAYSRQKLTTELNESNSESKLYAVMMIVQLQLDPAPTKYLSAEKLGAKFKNTMNLCRQKTWMPQNSSACAKRTWIIGKHQHISSITTEKWTVQTIVA